MLQNNFFVEQLSMNVFFQGLLLRNPIKAAGIWLTKHPLQVIRTIFGNSFLEKKVESLCNKMSVVESCFIKVTG